jgi:hypothetical protein
MLRFMVFVCANQPYTLEYVNWSWDVKLFMDVWNLTLFWTCQNMCPECILRHLLGSMPCLLLFRHNLSIKVTSSTLDSFFDIFFFWFEETSPPRKTHFVGPDEGIKLRHALTRTRDLLCRFQTFCHHATPLGESFFNMFLVKLQDPMRISLSSYKPHKLLRCLPQDLDHMWPAR